jgi:hypothetical protein
MVQDLVVEVYLFRSPNINAVAGKPAQPARKVRQQLEHFVSLLGENHKVRKCAVKLKGVVTNYNPNETMAKFGKLRHCSEEGWRAIVGGFSGCCFNVPSSAFGKADLDIDELEVLCRQSVDVDQQVLEPLAKLRGMRDVQVLGRVTDDWARFLKSCMESEFGVRVIETVYEHRTVAQWDTTSRRKRSRR